MSVLVWEVTSTISISELGISDVMDSSIKRAGKIRGSPSLAAEAPQQGPQGVTEAPRLPKGC